MYTHVKKKYEGSRPTPLKSKNAISRSYSTSFRSIFLAAIIAGIYVNIPWETLSGTVKFTDLDNYLTNASLLQATDDIITNSGLGLLFAEPGWMFILLLISKYADDQANGFLLISWISSSIFFWFMKPRAGFLLSLLVLLNPLVIDLALSQIRSAFALSLLLLALGSKNKIFRAALILYAFTVHSVSFVLVGIYFISNWIQISLNRRTPLEKGGVCLSIGLFLAFIFARARETIFTLIGDRRAEYDIDPGSVLYVTFWFLWALTFSLMHRSIFRKPWHWVDGAIIITFSLAFFMTMLSTYGVRFVALAMPLFACTMASMHSGFRYSGILVFTLYQLVQFAYWY